MSDTANSAVEGSDHDRAEWVRGLLDLYGGPLTGYAARLLNGDVERARDVVQDTFLKLIEADRAEIEDHLAAWLYTVCRHRTLDVKRKERRMSTLDDQQAAAIPAGSDGHAKPAAVSLSDPPSPLSASVEAPEERSQMFRALESLPIRQQEVIRLKFQNGLSYKEISRITDLTVSNVGYLIHVGLKTLREKLNAATTPVLSPATTPNTKGARS